MFEVATATRTSCLRGRLWPVWRSRSRAALREAPALMSLLLRYTEAALLQAMQSAACNARHPIEQRILVKKVTHRVHKNHSWPLPGKRLRQPLRTKSKIKARFKGMIGHTTKALRKASGIAIIASCTDFGAARHGVLRSVRPLDRSSFCHNASPSDFMFSNCQSGESRYIWKSVFAQQ